VKAIARPELWPQYKAFGGSNFCVERLVMNPTKVAVGVEYCKRSTNLNIGYEEMRFRFKRFRRDVKPLRYLNMLRLQCLWSINDLMLVDLPNPHISISGTREIYA
ncbi:unnamed protein product, partial [Brassica napus]